MGAFHGKRSIRDDSAVGSTVAGAVRAGVGVDSSRPLNELAFRGALTTAHLGIGRLFKFAQVKREVRHRGEMRWALWRVGLPRVSKVARRGKLLWIPGWGDTPLTWLPLAIALGARNGFEELVVLDFPGFHGSLAHARCITKIDRCFEISSDLIQEVRPELIVGHSLGGWLAARGALEGSGSALEKLILISPSGYCGGIEQRKEWHEEFQKVLSSSSNDYLPLGWKKVGAWFLPFISREDSREFLESIEDRHFLDSIDQAKLKGLFSLDLDILWGRDDLVVPSRFAQTWSQNLPHAKITVWDNVGHLPHLEVPLRLFKWLNEKIST